MKTVSKSGALRAHVGKKDAKKHRREGNIPCVLYGGKEQIHFTMPEVNFKNIIFTPEVFIIELTIDDKKYMSILKDVQYHPVTDTILHADFLEVIDGKPVVIGIPLKFVGTAPGLILGGKLRKKVRKLIVKGLVQDLPDFIEISISKLGLNDNIKVRDISYPNLEILDTPSAEIVGVKTGRGAGMDIPLDEDLEEGETTADATPDAGDVPASEVDEGEASEEKAE